MMPRVVFASVAQGLLQQSRDEEDAAAAVEEAQDAHSQTVHVPDVTDRLQRTFAEDAVSRTVIHDDVMIEHLPALSAPELKMIGRCVSFGMRQKTANGLKVVYYYTGLVAAVTATAVTLMHVNRYTEGDFRTYKEREKKAVAAAAAAALNRPPTGAKEPLDFPEMDCAATSLVLTAEVPHLTAQESVGVRDDDMDDDVARFPFSFSDIFSSGSGGGAATVRPPRDVRGSLGPAVQMITGEELEHMSVHHHRPVGSSVEATVAESGAGNDGESAAGAPQARRPANLRACGDSLGPLPCATFLRKSIHDVAFGRAPDSTFFHLFQNPEKAHVDMQYLRMFVRRYLVHTSEGNNPRQLPLRRYIVKHGACQDVEKEVVEKVAREELLSLVNTDRAIVKEKRRMRSRIARREEAIRDYRAPPGLFASTGFLYLTGLPQGSLLAAATLLFFTLVFALNYVLTVQVFGDGLTQYLFTEMSDYFTAAIVIWTATSFLTVYHALTMRVPSVANAPVLLLRAMSSAASAIYAIVCMAVISQCASNHYIYEGMVRSPSQALCAFYESHQCSGFYTSCGRGSLENALCRTCQPIAFPATTCYRAVTEQLQRVMVPLFLFSVVIFFGSVHALFLLLRLFLVARAASLTSNV